MRNSLLTLGIAAVCTVAVAQGPKPAEFDLQWSDVRSVTLTPVGNGVAVEFRMTPQKGRSFSEFTEQNIGRTVAFKLNDQKVAEPHVREKITGDSMALTASSLADALAYLQRFNDAAS